MNLQEERAAVEIKSLFQHHIADPDPQPTAPGLNSDPKLVTNAWGYLENSPHSQTLNHSLNPLGKSTTEESNTYHTLCNSIGPIYQGMQDLHSSLIDCS